MVCPAGWGFGFGAGGSDGDPAAASRGSTGRGRNRDQGGELRVPEDLSPMDGRGFLLTHGS